jgi:hypothetical protein
MAQQTINIGTVANDNTGDPIRDAFDKINDNFDEIYITGIGGSTLAFSGNDITASVLDDDVTITANGNGIIVLDTDTINVSTTRTPATGVGAVGDTAGDICWDPSFIYVCVADYDGATSPIWKKSAIVDHV